MMSMENDCCTCLRINNDPSYCTKMVDGRIIWECGACGKEIDWKKTEERLKKFRCIAANL